MRNAADGEHLYAAILAEPDVDAHRLVYADWLEEGGREDETAHARFIRVQIELAQIPLDDVSPRRIELCIKCLHFTFRHDAMRLLNLDPECGVILGFYIYPDRDYSLLRSAILLHRGFPWGAVLSAEAWKKYGARLAATTPLQFAMLENRAPEKRPSPLLNGEPNWTWWLLAHDSGPLYGMPRHWIPHPFSAAKYWREFAIDSPLDDYYTSHASPWEAIKSLSQAILRYCGRHARLAKKAKSGASKGFLSGNSSRYI